jgi:hypothetical protein
MLLMNMKNITIAIIILLGVSGCNNPSELPLLDIVKPVDEFARGYISNIISGSLDSCFAKTDPEILTDSFKNFISNANHNLKNVTLKKYNIVDESGTIGVGTDAGKYEYYSLGYEYEMENSYVLFVVNVSKKDGKFSVTACNGSFLQAPLSVLTEFTLKHRSIPQYIFLVITILMPIFILATLFVMLFSKMTIKKKIAWVFIILLISLPRFYMNWGTGQFGFNLININLIDAGYSRPNLYSYWMLYFNVPIGAIIFWVKRKRLLQEPMPAYIEPEIPDEVPTEDVFTNTDISTNEDKE